MKISAAGVSISTQLSNQQGAPIGRLQQHPMSALLFGKKPPKLVDKRKYPKLRKGMKKLESYRDEIAGLLGRQPEDFPIELCEGDNACISRNGQLAFGVELMEKHQDDDELLLGIIGHEMGHQPWDWPDGDMSHLTKKQLNQLYRDEEAKADRFAGRVLAELGFSPQAVSDFLLKHGEKFEEGQVNDYYPAPVRADMIKRSHGRRKRMLEARGRYGAQF